MTDDVFVYLVNLPGSVSEMVAPGPDGYTVYIDAGLSGPERLDAYKHALAHIAGKDWERSDVGEIEAEARKRARGASDCP